MGDGDGMGWGIRVGGLGCESRTEGIVKRYCAILSIIKIMKGGVWETGG